MGSKKKVPLVEGRLKFVTEDKAVLIGIKCNLCQEVVFPRLLLCPACGREDVEEVTLNTRGKIWTYTIAYVNYGSIFLTPPYPIAFVELEGGGFVHTAIVNCDQEEIRIGLDVELELIKTDESDQEESYVYAFKPA